jgi:hypothetical protein
MTGIAADELPQTLQDAVAVTHGLGLQYLWIDAICIIQDSDVDKDREIAMMPEIYKSGRVTIMASSGAACTEGFLHHRLQEPTYSIEMCHAFWILKEATESKQKFAGFKLPYLCPDGRVGSVEIGVSPWCELISENGAYSPKTDPINSRAWTLQERLLSPRVLEYGKSQLRWICRSVEQFDGGFPSRDLIAIANASTNLTLTRETGRRPSHFYSTLMSPIKSVSDPKAFLIEWWKIVEDYSHRSTSLPEDKLVAISALVQEFSQSYEAEYLAGLWNIDLPINLLWTTGSKWPIDPYMWFDPELCQCKSGPILVDCGNNPRPNIYRAPSWSWASIDESINGPPILSTAFRKPEQIIEILGCNICPKSSLLPFGQIANAELVIKGYLLQLKFQKHIRHWRDKFHFVDLIEKYQQSFHLHSVQFDAIEEHSVATWWLPVLDVKSSIVGLLLQYNSDGDYFRRVGTAQIVDAETMQLIPQKQFLKIITIR